MLSISLRAYRLSQGRVYLIVSLIFIFRPDWRLARFLKRDVDAHECLSLRLTQLGSVVCSVQAYVGKAFHLFGFSCLLKVSSHSKGVPLEH